MKKKLLDRNGFSLVEMLIALAVSAIIIAAAFGSYAMIARNFDFQKDMKYIAQSARAVVDMVNSDIRLAGYTAVDNGAITDAVMLSDSGTATCCDAISVVYDQTPTERRQVTYYTKQYTSDVTRFRLYKHICQVSTPFTIAQIQAGQCPATATLLAENPIADYVEDLQFTSFGKSGCTTNPSPGSFIPGCGVTGVFSPDDGFSPVDNFQGYPVRFVSHVTNRNVQCGGGGSAIDSDFSTFLSCGVKNSPYNNYGMFAFQFDDYIKTTRVHLSTNAHLGCHLNRGNCDWSWDPQDGLGYPYGTGPGGGSSRDVSATYGYKLFAGIYDNGAYEHVGTTSGTVHSNGLNGNPYMGRFSANFNKAVNIFMLVMHNPKAYDYAPRPSKGDAPQGFGGGSGNSIALPEIMFEGEKYINLANQNIETSILIRSPNEHGNVDRSVGSPLTLGNRTNSWSDKHLRDSFTTATVVRNLYYSSQ